MHLATISDGDARKCLNALEIGVLTTPPDRRRAPCISPARWPRRASSARPWCTTRPARVTTTRSARSSKACAAPIPTRPSTGWRRCSTPGEDIRFIARRIVICAAEDVGLADPQALVVAVAAQQAAELVGLPEARIPLAEAAVYIATAPKSNRAYMAGEKASEEVREGRHAGRAPAPAGHGLPGAKRLGHGASITNTATTTRTPTCRRLTCRRADVTMSRATVAMEKRIGERLAHWRSRCSSKASRPRRQTPCRLVSRDSTRYGGTGHANARQEQYEALGDEQRSSGRKTALPLTGRRPTHQPRICSRVERTRCRCGRPPGQSAAPEKKAADDHAPARTPPAGCGATARQPIMAHCKREQRHRPALSGARNSATSSALASRCAEASFCSTGRTG